MKNRRLLADLREDPVASKLGVSVWIPGVTLRSELTCQMLVRTRSIEITTRPRLLGRVLGFDWIVPGDSIWLTEEMRPHEIGPRHRWLGIAPNSHTEGRQLCLRAHDMEQLAVLLEGVGAKPL
jgi:hypothetical protein